MTKKKLFAALKQHVSDFDSEFWYDKVPALRTALDASGALINADNTSTDSGDCLLINYWSEAIGHTIVLYWDEWRSGVKTLDELADFLFALEKEAHDLEANIALGH
jgi:hypothetical protein